jgi:hypothetical protein
MFGISRAIPNRIKIIITVGIAGRRIFLSAQLMPLPTIMPAFSTVNGILLFLKTVSTFLREAK